MYAETLVNALSIWLMHCGSPVLFIVSVGMDCFSPKGTHFSDRIIYEGFTLRDILSFFDDNKKVGLAFITVGIISIISALASIVVALVTDVRYVAAVIVVAVGALIFGVFILFFGINTRKGSNDKVAIVSGFLRVLGVTNIIIGICAIIAAIISAGGFLTGILTIIFGLIQLWASSKVSGDNKNVIGKILWVLLLIIFLLLAIIALLSILTLNILVIINSICMFFVYVYMVIAMLSPEVKKSMGV